MNKIYVLYHKNCPDGFGAAFAAWKNLGSKATYIAVTHNEPPPEMDDQSHVYILDFSYPREELLKLKERMEFVLVLDHHKTAEEALKGLDFCYFDMNKSGAMLAWDHFHPGKEVPAFFSYLQDRDLWKYEFEYTEAFTAGLASFPYTFETWDKYLDDTDTLVNRGLIILDYKKQQVDMICKQATWHKLQIKNKDKGDTELKFIAVNTTSNWSDVCHKLLELYPESPFSGGYYFDNSGNKVWSLRSRGDFDVSNVAKALGGGGHAAAAGFKQKL